MSAVLAAAAIARLAWGSPACPRGATLMASTENWTVCEDLSSRTGAVTFFTADGAELASLGKTAAPMYGCGNRTDDSRCYLGHQLQDVLGNHTDVLGDALLRKAKAASRDVTLEEVMAAVPPLVYNGGFNLRDPVNCGGSGNAGRCKAYSLGGNVHTFTSSRGSSVVANFDALGTSTLQMNYPDMNQWPAKYSRSSAVFKDPTIPERTREGLWGGHLPIVTYHFALGNSTHYSGNCKPPQKPCQAHPKRCCGPSDDDGTHTQQGTEMVGANGWVEWTAVPVPDMEGNLEQDLFFRVIKVRPDGTVADVRYFNTYGMRGIDLPGLDPSVNDNATVPGMGHPVGSKTAGQFYATVLEQQRYWDQTFAAESPVGMAKLNLPTAEGKLLRDQAVHSLVRDMISKYNTWFPNYGTLPNDYGMPEGNGCDLNIAASMYASLELGAFENAKGVLDNWLRFYVRPDGLRYRGPNHAFHGRQLAIFALYVQYTGDTALLEKYYDKALVFVTQLRALRQRSLRLPATHPAYGMPSGQLNGDLRSTAIGCGTTYGAAGESALPGEITGDMAKDCHTDMPYFGIATEMERGFTELGAVFQRVGAAHSRPDISTTGVAMVAEAEQLHTDLMGSINKTMAASKLDCLPIIAGWTVCPGTQPSGYKYPSLDIFDGGNYYWADVLPDTLTAQITAGVSQFTMTGPGSMYGSSDLLLQQDRVEEMILGTFEQSAHGMSRGTWTATEVSVLPRTAPSSGYTGYNQAAVTANVKWMLLWERMQTKTLWIGKAIPRAWLLSGQRVAVEDATTRYGRLSFSIVATSSSSYTVNVTCTTAEKAFAPPGGIKLRVRSPSFLHGSKISQVTVGGQPWSQFNASEETILFKSVTDEMQHIVVTFASHARVVGAEN
jgi:hypothetical protein